MILSDIRYGEKWLDQEGRPIQAHGFTVFYDESNDRYVWFGENKDKTRWGGKIWTYGINYYTSKDLNNWEYGGMLIPPSEDINEPLYPGYCIDRPHILYCRKTGKYVCWIKVMAGGVNQFMTVLEADVFTGPYHYVNKFYNPLDMDSGDFDLYADPETGKAYIWFERPHFQLICAELTDDYRACSGEYSTHLDGLKPPYTREAPVFFTRNGKKYLFTSGTSGYFPNATKVYTFDDVHGEYTDLGDPFIGDKTHTSFSSQITDVLHIPGTDSYIACADRWMGKSVSALHAKLVLAAMKWSFRNYEPDTEKKHITAVSGKETRYFDRTNKARYVWLPIEWDGDRPVIRWRE